MDNIKAENKKKRGKRKKRRPPPLPIFHSDRPASNDPMPGVSLFPGNSVAPRNIFLNQNEIMNKFSELLDWSLPAASQNTHGDFIDRRAYEDTDLDDRRAYGYADLDNWRAYGDTELDERRTYSDVDVNFAQERSPFQNPFNQGKHGQLDLFDLRNRIGHLSKRLKSIQDPDVNLSKDSFDRSQKDTGHDFYDNKETWNQKIKMLTDSWAPNSKQARLNSSNSDERRVGDSRIYPSADLLPDFDRQVKEYWPDSEQRRKEQSSHPSLGLQIDYPNERGFRRNRNEVNDDRTDDDFREEDYIQSDNHSRRPDREAGDRLDIQKRWDNNQYSNQYCNQDLRYSASMPRKNHSNEEQMLAGSLYNRFSDQDPTSMPRKNYLNEGPVSAVSFYNRFSDKNSRNPASVPKNNNSNKEHVCAGSSQNQFRDDKNKQGKFEKTQSMNQDHDLIVVIHKQNFARFSPTEADILRSMLIDLVVNCGNPNEMPEFVSSGLMRSGRAFYLNCRTMETMRWLLKQSLSPLNGLNLYIRKDKVYQVVKISAYAQRCTRTRKEIIKLLKLQNGKKGFNFDNWTMKSYNTSPTGIYFAFNVPLEDAQLLKDMGRQLSFELKSLKFKIVMSSVQTVSSLPW